MPGQRPYASHLVSERAELGLESHRVEPLSSVRQRPLPVLVPEERRIREARAHDTLVALHNLRNVAALDVADRNEVRQQMTLRVLDGEVTLMVLQGRDEHFARQRQEILIEAAADRHRPFDQRGDFVQQSVAEQRVSAELGGGGRDSIFDRLAPGVEARQHIAAPSQGPFVRGRRSDSDRLGCVEAMPACSIPRGSVQHPCRDDFLSVKHHEPMHRSDELRGPRSPVHAACDRQSIEGRLNDRREQLLDALARFAADEVQERAFAFIEPLQGFDRRAATLSEGERRSCRESRGVE